MASPAILDFDALLKPLAGDSAAGTPLPYDVRLKLEDFRKEVNPDDYDADDPRRPADFRAPDWAAIIKLATDTLADASKDLLAAARLVEALTMQHRFAGLRDGLELLLRLATECWDRVHPMLEAGESVEAREGPFNWLNQLQYGARFPHTLRVTPLIVVKGKGHSFEDWQKQDRRGAFETALAEVSRETCQDLVDDLKSIKEKLTALADILQGKMGEIAPDLVSSENTQNLGAAVNDCLKIAQQLLSRKSGSSAADDDSETSASSEGGSAMSGNLSSRADAYRMLNQAADLLQRLEPHSPIPYLVKRAVHLGEMKFPELMKALLRENAALDELYRFTGVEPPPPPP